MRMNLAIEMQDGTTQEVTASAADIVKFEDKFTKKLSVQSCSKLTAALYQPATLKGQLLAILLKLQITMHSLLQGVLEK